MCSVQQAQEGSEGGDDRDAVNTGFNAKLPELVVLRSKRDNNVDVKNAPANLDDSESLGGYDSFSTGDEGGEEEEDEDVRAA